MLFCLLYFFNGAFVFHQSIFVVCFWCHWTFGKAFYFARKIHVFHSPCIIVQVLSVTGIELSCTSLQCLISASNVTGQRGAQILWPIKKQNQTKPKYSFPFKIKTNSQLVLRSVSSSSKMLLFWVGRKDSERILKNGFLVLQVIEAWTFSCVRFVARGIF